MKLNPDVVILNALEPSPLNARATEEYDAEKIAGLADSIEVLGLLQPLVVHSIGKGKYGVIAGGRRLAALNKLVDEDRIARNDPLEVDVMVADGTDAELREASITENYVREPMTDVQIYKSVKATRDEKSSVNLSDEQLAAAFGVGVARMRRILRLAYIHPEILEAYEKGEMDQRALMAYGKTDDLEKQKACFDAECEKQWNQHQAHTITSFYGFGDRDQLALLKYVGEDAYKEAGGRMTEDLFEEDSVAIADEDLLADLADKKFAAELKKLRADHPDWTFDTAPPQTDQGYPDYALRGKEVLSDEDKAEWDKLDEEIEGLADELLELVDLDEYWNTDDLLEAKANDGKGKEVGSLKTKIKARQKKLDAIQDRKAIPDAANLVVVSLERDGTLKQERWYPDRAAAGYSEKKATEKAQEDDKPAEPVDPANPTLTQRASAFIKAERYLMGLEMVTADNKDGEATARIAHLALIFRMARSLAHEGLNSYGVDRMLGDVYDFQGVPKEKRKHPDYVEILQAVPGIMEDDAIAGFEKFMTIDAQLLDRVAALLYAVKAPVADGPGTSLNQLVLMHLDNPTHARAAWTPTLEFFDLFKKDTILAWFGEIDPQFRLDRSKDKVADLKVNAVQFFRAGEDAVKRFGMTGEAQKAAAEWMPPFLRWTAEAEAEAETETED